MKFSSNSYIRWVATATDNCEILLHSSGMIPPPADWFKNVAPISFSQQQKAIYEDKLKNLIAKRNNVNKNQIILTRGATEANFLILSSMLRQEDLVATEVPFYEPIINILQNLNCTVLPLFRAKEDNYSISMDNLDLILESGIRLVFISNLHNPTGQYISEKDLRYIIEKIEKSNAYILVDEVYLDFLFSNKPNSAVILGDRVITTSSLTKVYGLDTIRVGWAIANEEVIHNALKVQEQIFGPVSILSTIYAIEVFENIDRFASWSELQVTSSKTAIDIIMSKQRYLKWVPPVGGLIGLFDLPKELTGVNFSAYLRNKYKTLVTPGEFFGAPNTIRIGFGKNPTELEEAFRRIDSALEDLLL